MDDRRLSKEHTQLLRRPTCSCDAEREPSPDDWSDLIAQDFDLGNFVCRVPGWRIGDCNEESLVVNVNRTSPHARVRRGLLNGPVATVS
jgi:hypothetical protein